MPLPLLTRKIGLLAEIEGTYGVDPVPTGTDNAVLAQNLVVGPTYDVIERRNVALPDLSLLPHLIGRYWCEITFDVELKGAAGDPDDTPDFGPLLRACYMSQTINGGTSVVYAPESSTQESVTIYANLDGILHKLVGCMGDWSLAGAVGQPALFSFSFKGKLAGVLDTAMPAMTYLNLNPPLILSAGFLYDSWDVPVSKFTIALKNEVAEREDVREASGLLGFFIGSRAPEASWDPEVQTLASRDVWANLAAANEGALAVTIGSVAGNQVAIAAPKCVKKKAAYGDRGGKLIYDLDFGLYRTSGNDEITLTFS